MGYRGAKFIIRRMEHRCPLPRKKSHSSPAPRAASGLRRPNGFSPTAGGWRCSTSRATCCAARSPALADPDNTLALHCDVSDADAVAAAMATVSARFGRLDALVNNAGIAVFAPLLETSDADWNRVLAGQPHRAVHLHQGGGAADARTWRRRDRQHHLDLGGARLDAALGLRHQQGRARASDQAARGRTGLARHPRQRAWRPARSRPRWPSRSIRRKSAPTITTPFRSTATASRRNWRKRSSSCAAIAPATSPGRSSPSTAVSTPPASACRRCAARRTAADS